MWTKRIGISLEKNYELPIKSVIRLIRKVGFDAISPVWSEELGSIVKFAREEGLAIQSLHAPQSGTREMWSESAPKLMQELLFSIKACREHKIPILVVHTWSGFTDIPEPTALGLRNFTRIVNKAKACGIKIAFENLEGENHLEALMNYFKGDETVGFCWDSGHENCYRHGDILSKYADRLLITHLNDNLGVRQADGSIFWTDDLHLLPFDGVEDWAYNAKRLSKAKPCKFINIEIKKRLKTECTEYARYEKMTLEEYFSNAYEKACRFADMVIKK